LSTTTGYFLSDKEPKKNSNPDYEDHCSELFFSKMIARPLHQSDAHDLLFNLKVASSITTYYNIHGSHKVVTWISQRKSKYIDTISILYSISMQPATLVEDSPNDHHQPSTSNIHKFPQILGQEKGPHVDPISSSVHNLQKLIMSHIVKNNIITTIPNCPNQRAYPYSNPFLIFFIYTIEPLMSTHASILVDSVGPPSAEVCRAATSFP
jgi:hypothetical protein